MATTQKTITVTRQQDEWIKGKVAAGDFADDSEYIRGLIRLDQARQREVEQLRAALREGELSGEPVPFDPEEFKKSMAAAHAQDGR